MNSMDSQAAEKKKMSASNPFLNSSPTGQNVEMKGKGGEGTHTHTHTRGRARARAQEQRERERERERENSKSNAKTLFYKDCSFGSVKNLSNN